MVLKSNLLHLAGRRPQDGFWWVSGVLSIVFEGVELEFRDGVGWNGESYENKGVWGGVECCESVRVASPPTIEGFPPFILHEKWEEFIVQDVTMRDCYV